MECHKKAASTAHQLKSVAKQSVAVGNLGLSGYKDNDAETAKTCMKIHLKLSAKERDQLGQDAAARVLGELAQVTLISNRGC